MPVVLYNIPGRTGITMTPTTIAHIYNECTNVVAIKDATGSLDMVCVACSTHVYIVRILLHAARLIWVSSTKWCHEWLATFHAGAKLTHRRVYAGHGNCHAL